MSKRVMVVDDSRIVQLQLKKILADTEYQIVAFCQSGEEALERYGEIQPDLVTMDILMPGIDGLETARQILKAYPNARILMVSSLAYDDTINEANDVGVKGFVYKPFERNQILESISNVFRDA
ncbi:response regulator [Candidatus Agathobaculum pullicola]|uniref:response regulator n=1 Tax=Candidatus Agathobaculum pullicola TaxID=2838426 RepID=UPI003F8F5FF8